MPHTFIRNIIFFQSIFQSINEAPFSVNYYAFYCVIRDWGDEEMFGESE